MFSISKKMRRVLLAVIAATITLSPAAVSIAAQPVDRTQALVAAASAQFQLSFRMRPAEGQLRQEQLRAAVAAWRAAPRNEFNDERLRNWLREAIRASMPGSRAALPAIPNFGGESPQAPQVTDPPPVAPPEPTPTVGPEDPSPDSEDPFRDDPADLQETK